MVPLCIALYLMLLYSSSVEFITCIIAVFLSSQIHNSLKARIISFFPLQKYLVSSNASYKMFENNKLSQPLPFFVSGMFHIEKDEKEF